MRTVDLVKKVFCWWVAFSPSFVVSSERDHKEEELSDDIVSEGIGHSTARTSISKLYLNAIDNVHEIFENDRDLVKNVPSFVVVRMQSVGKSAVLSRISGIRFPQDSEVCTRVAIELRLRRVRNIQNDTLKTLTIKTGNGGVQLVEKTNHVEIEKELKKAQHEVLGGREFEDKISIKVEKEGVDLPEVTLIDLPGIFFAKEKKTEELEESVKRMVENRINNKMALILHVIPLNQDADTISTWRIVEETDKSQQRTIPVLTKADLAVNDGKDVFQRRIKKILAESNFSEYFIINGAAETIEEEDNQLKFVKSYIEDLHLVDRVKVGVKELNNFIESRMLEHIKEKIPEMILKLEEHIHSCEKELNDLGRHPKPPRDLALEYCHSVSKYFADAYESFQPRYRRFTEAMAEKMNTIKVEPLGLLEDEEIKLVSIRFNEGAEEVTLALEVMQVGENSRKMINSPYAGKTTELEAWLQTLVVPLEKILKGYIQDTFVAFYDEVFKDSIEGASTEMTKAAVKYVEVAVRRDLIFRERNIANKFADYFVDSVKKNNFISDQNSLNVEYSKCINQLDKFLFVYNQEDSYLKPHLHTVCNIRAFFAVRISVLPDAIQLYYTKMIDDLVRETEKQVIDVVLSEEVTRMIKEPTSIEMRRKFLSKREKKMKNALELIRVF